VVNLRHLLSSLRPSSLVASVGLFLGGGVDEGGPILGIQVCQLHCHLCIVKQKIGQDLLIHQTDKAIFLDYLAIPGDLVAAVTCLQYEHPAMLVATVSEA
jgi:hypothetical protein